MISIQNFQKLSPWCSSPLHLLFFFILFSSSSTATLIGYPFGGDYNNSFTEQYRGILASYGLQIPAGHGVPGYVIRAKGQQNPSDDYACSNIQPFNLPTTNQPVIIPYDPKDSKHPVKSYSPEQNSIK